ncbi:translocation protein, partial [Ramicandelaber brevisporus]
SSAPKEIWAVVKYLRSSSAGIKLREGVVNGRRVEYFKGKSAINALMRDEYQSGSRPSVSSRQDATSTLTDVLSHFFFVRCERQPDDTRMLQISPMQTFDEEHYYAWLYEGSQVMVILGGLALVSIVLAGVMFPLWPAPMRNGAWYVSMAALGCLGLLFAIAIVRLIFYIITVVVASPGIWIFPNLFEDVGFFESFVPLWAWDLP